MSYNLVVYYNLILQISLKLFFKSDFKKAFDSTKKVIIPIVSWAIKDIRGAFNQECESIHKI